MSGWDEYQQARAAVAASAAAAASGTKPQVSPCGHDPYPSRSPVGDRCARSCPYPECTGTGSVSYRAHRCVVNPPVNRDLGPCGVLPCSSPAVARALAGPRCPAHMPAQPRGYCAPARCYCPGPTCERPAP